MAILPLALALALSLTLTSCGPRVLSPQAYQELVIETLKGDLQRDNGAALPLPGLIVSIRKLFDSLYCAEYSCVFPSEMEYAAMIAERTLVDIYTYKARICTEEKVRPPRELQPVHEKICAILDGIRADVDAIKLTAQLAARLLAHSEEDPSSLERISRSYSAKIMERRDAIIEALRQLRKVKWLEPVFMGAESKLPELEINPK